MDHIDQGVYLVLDLIMTAACVDLLHSAFADHAATLKIKGQFVYKAAVLLDIQVGMLKNSPVKQVVKASLEIAVQIGVVQDLFAGVPDDIDMAFKNDQVLSQGACLICA